MGKPQGIAKVIYWGETPMENPSKRIKAGALALSASQPAAEENSRRGINVTNIKIFDASDAHRAREL
jgi:hypothetical protein